MGTESGHMRREKKIISEETVKKGLMVYAEATFFYFNFVKEKKKEGVTKDYQIAAA